MEFLMWNLGVCQCPEESKEKSLWFWPRIPANHSALEAKQVHSKFKANPIYTSSSAPARATQRRPVLNKRKNSNKESQCPYNRLCLWIPELPQKQARIDLLVSLTHPLPAPNAIA